MNVFFFTSRVKKTLILLRTGCRMLGENDTFITQFSEENWCLHH
jgi:hypothetical protein